MVKDFTMDKRYELAKERLSQLTDEEIRRIITDIDSVLFDTYNYSEGKYCPIAVAMNLHKTTFNPTDDVIRDEIAKRFNPVNIFKGAVGEFYTYDRKDDLISLCNEILHERSK